MTSSSESEDFYGILGVPRNAPLSDVKIAYHRTLLRLHPDKQSRKSRTTTRSLEKLTEQSTRSVIVDMALVKEAYGTLSDARLRAAYDRSSRRDARPDRRPAEVVSLEEFTEVDVADIDMGSESGFGSGANAVRREWQHRCRCGGIYHVTEDDLENEMHLVGCESCSEVIWVGYEELIMEDE